MRRSPLYEELKAKGAVFGSKFGFERANCFTLPTDSKESKDEEPSFNRCALIAGFAWCVLTLCVFGRPAFATLATAREHKAVRERVALIDQSSFAKLEGVTIILAEAGAHSPSFLRASVWPARVREPAAHCCQRHHWTRWHRRLHAGVQWPAPTPALSCFIVLSSHLVQLCNERGGIEADVTIARLDEQLFYITTGSG
jgi:glycine cleavage system aminomethyltransferase T